MINYSKNKSLNLLFYINDEGLVCQEEFRCIPDYENIYSASNLGRVKSVERIVAKSNGTNMSVKEKILTQSNQKSGYLKINLYNKSVENQFLTHQLVAMAFLGHVPDGTNRIVVDHIDEVRNNNVLTNLRLLTNRENSSMKEGGSSIYTGVCWLKNRNKWESRIRYKGKLRHLGNYIDEYDEHLAYQKALEQINKGTFPDYIKKTSQ